MSRLSSRLVAALLAVALLDGCGLLHFTPASQPVDVAGEWSSTLTQARQEVVASRFGVADRVLSDFAARFPGTTESYEVSYYRALFKLDPANQTGTLREATSLLESYLAAPVTLRLRADASSLRRIALALDRPAPPQASVAASSSASSGAAPAAAAAKADDKTRDEEVQRLREELAKANAELDRIKKRLSQPKP